GSGSMTGYQGSVYTWDVLRQATTVNTGSESWVHIYDVAGERVWSWRTSSSRLDNYALRGQDGRVLRFFANNGSTLTWEDYVYREGDLVGAVAPDGTPRHFDVDHLGSVRLETGGLTTPYHEYWAYGEEATPPAGSERMKFTGHERDLGVLTSTADDIDYMHARYYRPLLARFLSVDSHGGDPHNPKSWNRYSYTYDNPLKLVDPNGLEPLPTNWRYFFNVFFDADFSGVDVQRGFVAHTLASGEVGAMTIGSTIFLNKDVDASYDAARPASIALIGHELAHVLQYQHLGIRRFLEGYLQNYAYNRAQGQSGFDAYQNIVLEEIARQIQGVLRSFLEQHPEIAAKLASGADFTEAEMKAVSDALAEAASNGTFKYGFQFVQGFLVYVAPPK
ncbi:MAG TPA: RHS repeat-associated core domain-containing protein, partial [Thermoanaerobaculia bacterium]|nr:RHS repeat-associated core domain-containing protein [Thermoanaerobaculia bacterium]